MIKLLFKGILLYLTSILVLFYLCALDSLLISNNLIISTILIATLVYINISYITKDELDKLLFHKKDNSFKDTYFD